MSKENSKTSRRKFIKSTGAAALGGSLALNISLANTPTKKRSDTLKIGLIGCGGRGTGAASQALTADDNVILTTVGDVFTDRLNTSYETLLKKYPERIKVGPAHQFSGFDAYQKVIDSRP